MVRRKESEQRILAKKKAKLASQTSVRRGAIRRILCQESQQRCKEGQLDDVGVPCTLGMRRFYPTGFRLRMHFHPTNSRHFLSLPTRSLSQTNTLSLLGEFSSLLHGRSETRGADLKYTHLLTCVVDSHSQLNTYHPPTNRYLPEPPTWVPKTFCHARKVSLSVTTFWVGSSRSEEKQETELVQHFSNMPRRRSSLFQPSYVRLRYLAMKQAYRLQNVTSSSTVVAALEAARDKNAPIILQTSQGGAAYFAGKVRTFQVMSQRTEY